MTHTQQRLTDSSFTANVGIQPRPRIYVYALIANLSLCEAAHELETSRNGHDAVFAISRRIRTILDGEARPRRRSFLAHLVLAAYKRTVNERALRTAHSAGTMCERGELWDTMKERRTKTSAALGIFAVIVLSVLVFAVGFSIVGRLPEEPAERNIGR
jgi:hypothetical protein